MKNRSIAIRFRGLEIKNYYDHSPENDRKLLELGVEYVKQNERPIQEDEFYQKLCLN